MISLFDSSIVHALTVTSTCQFAFMFAGSGFNQDISGWDLSSATKMDHMFISNHAINQELCRWGRYYDASVNYANMFYNTKYCTELNGKNNPTSAEGPWCSCEGVTTDSPSASVSQGMSSGSPPFVLRLPDCHSSFAGPAAFYQVTICWSQHQSFGISKS